MRKRITDADRKIGARIKARRVAMGITLEEMGEIIDVTFQQAQKICNGTNRVSVVNLTKLAKRMEVPVSYFLAEDHQGENDAGMQFLSTKDGAQIVRAMSKIADARLRRTIAELVVRLADAANLAAHPIILQPNGSTANVPD